jgi:hypothetical protein
MVDQQRLSRDNCVFSLDRPVCSTSTTLVTKAGNKNQNSFKTGTLSRSLKHDKKRSLQLQLKKEKVIMRPEEQLFERHKRIKQ